MAGSSCLSCVHYVGSGAPAGRRVAVTGSPDVSAAVCGRLSAVLALAPDMPAERAERVAGACSQFSTDPALADAGPLEEVGGPFLSVARVPDLAPVTDASAGVAASCSSCAHGARTDELADAGALGWDSQVAPMAPSFCGAKGALVPSAWQGVAPAKCGAFSPRKVNSPNGGAVFLGADLFAHIREDLEVVDAGAVAVADDVQAAPEPGSRSLSSIKTGDGKTGSIKTGDGKTGSIKTGDGKTGSIKTGDGKTGICGSFRVFSDDKKRHVDLPVFDPDSFDDTERAKIPQAGDDAAPELFDDYGNLAYRVAAAWALGETPALTGAAGLGKSQTAYYLAWKMGLPLERVSITSASQLDDLAGYTELRRGDSGAVTEFVHGRIPQAWSKRCITLLDEPNTAPPEVWQFLRPLTDSAKQLILDVNHGERVARNDHSYLMLAMNPAWDYRNTGVAALSDADGRRLVHVSVSAPDAVKETEIIRAHMDAYGLALSDEKLASLVAIGQELRSLADAEGGSGSLHITWGLSQQVKVAKLLGFFDFAEAFRLAGADNVDPSQRELIIGVVNRLSPAGPVPRRRGRKAAGDEQPW